MDLHFTIYVLSRRISDADDDHMLRRALLSLRKCMVQLRCVRATADPDLPRLDARACWAQSCISHDTPNPRQHRNKYRQFWQNAMTDNVAVDLLPAFIEAINDLETKAERNFERLLLEYPNSRSLLRLYAEVS